MAGGKRERRLILHRSYDLQASHVRLGASIAASAVFVVLLVGGLSGFTAAPQASGHTSDLGVSDVHAPPVLLGTTTATSHNWAGYAVSSSNHTVTSVSGSWVVPAIVGTCPSSKITFAVFWVGIDGYGGSNTVEQTGTSTGCSGGTPFYAAWYEFYPAGMITMSMVISPGDTITASVTYTSSGNVWSTNLKDTTNGNSGGSAQNVKGLARSSAEWVAEAPGKTSGGLYPLANFGSVTFTNCQATISGHTHAISGFSNVKITMWNNANTAKKAVPGALGSSGKSFKVTWKSAGP